MKTPHACVMLLFAVVTLGGCFMSAEPRIETGVSLARGPIALCPAADEPCQTGLPSGDSYVVASPDADEADTYVRFELLTEEGGVPIYLGEAELRKDDTSAWTYIVVRPSSATINGVPRFEMQLPDCGDVNDAEGARFALLRSDAYSCTVTDLDAFRAYLIEDYAAKFSDPDWWAPAR